MEMNVFTYNADANIKSRRQHLNDNVVGGVANMKRICVTNKSGYHHTPYTIHHKSCECVQVKISKYQFKFYIKMSISSIQVNRFICQIELIVKMPHRSSIANIIPSHVIHAQSMRDSPHPVHSTIFSKIFYHQILHHL